MPEIKFTKMAASGNDFVIIDNLRAKNLSALAKSLCRRKFGIGADGLLLLEKSKKADIRMRIFNADGSEAEMCGNGARCAALYARGQILNSEFRIKIETKAGIIESRVNGEKVKIKLTRPRDLKLNLPIKLNHRALCVNFINTGVPHAVIFVEGLDKIDVVSLGRQIRYHKAFAPFGANADFVEALNNNSIRARTYERGVEDETLACGTGAAASALLAAYGLPFMNKRKINVYTRSGEILKVYFERLGNSFKDVWLEGRARVVYKGVYYV